MQKAKSEKHTAPPWRVPVTVEDVPESGQHFALAADGEARAGIARLAGLRDLPRLEADFDVTRRGTNGLHVTGRISATVGQNCVVTLEPLDNEIAEEVDLVFMPQVAEPASDAETDVEPRDVKWGEPEPLVGGVVDLGVLATEFLILGLDPYPRKAGAVFEHAPESKPDGGPFAGLAGLTKERNGR